MLEQGLTKIAKAEAVNLNQAQNTALLTFTVIKPIRVQRFGVIADAAEGLLAANVLKLRQAPGETGTAADITDETLTVGAVIARGSGAYKTVGSPRTQYSPGDQIIIAVETAAGGTSTGDVFIEYAELPFAGSLIDNMTEKTS